MTPQEHYAKGQELPAAADQGRDGHGPITLTSREFKTSRAQAHFLAAIAGTVLDDAEVVS